MSPSLFLRGEHGQDLADLAAADQGDFLSHNASPFSEYSYVSSRSWPDADQPLT